LPVNLLARLKNQGLQLEAILLGQAGLLNGKCSDPYTVMLQKEYRFIRQKFNLRKSHQPINFLRTRPGNFPAIRLAQLAMLITGSSRLFTRIKNCSSLKEVKKLFSVTANDYWHYHYRLDQPSPFRKKRVGNAMIENLVINTVCPVLFAYGHCNGDEKLKARSLEWLSATAAERNHIIKGLDRVGIPVHNGFDSQSYTELVNEYCRKKRCLECAVGNAILKN
jgi:hypothetical protein